jgi:hypothetical protein
VAAPAIPEALHGAVREQASLGLTTRQIAAWLGDVHQVEASHHAVARLLAGQREDEAQVQGQLRAIVQAHEARTLALGLEALEHEGGHLVALCERLRGELEGSLDEPAPSAPQPGETALVPRGEGDGPTLPLEARQYARARTVGAWTGAYVRAIGALRQFTETKLKRAPGGDDEKRVRQQAAAELLRQRVEELAERQRAEIDRRAAQLAAADGAGGGAGAAGPDTGGAGGSSLPVEFLG